MSLNILDVFRVVGHGCLLSFEGLNFFWNCHMHVLLILNKFIIFSFLLLLLLLDMSSLLKELRVGRSPRGRHSKKHLLLVWVEWKLSHLLSAREALEELLWHHHLLLERRLHVRHHHLLLHSVLHCHLLGHHLLLLCFHHLHLLGRNLSF